MTETIMELPIISKSLQKREMTLYEAYLVIEDQKERMETLLKRSLMLSGYERKKITDHIMQLYVWLRDNRKIITIEFDLNTNK